MAFSPLYIAPPVVFAEFPSKLMLSVVIEPKLYIAPPLFSDDLFPLNAVAGPNVISPTL